MGRLYVVGTPIGNLGDLSPRAAEVLESVDFIAAEDTRVSVKLLNHLGIKKPLVSCHEHNIREASQSITARLLAGEDCAIVTDAGMPCISDPGEQLVDACHKLGIPVLSVPGPTAIATAVALSGLATARFTFEGFLSVNKSSRMEHLQSLKNETRTMVFYEAPHKLLRTLEDLLAVLGDREIAVCRELTKLHEETRRTTLSEAAAYYRDNAPRGEFVLVIAGAKPSEEPELTFEEAAELTRRRMEEGLSPAMAAKEVARATGYKKGDLYRAALEASGEEE